MLWCIVVKRNRATHSAPLPRSAMQTADLAVVIIVYLWGLFVLKEWLMRKWTSSLRGTLCQRIRDFTCGWSLRSGTQLELRIYSLLEQSLITLLVVAPLGVAICLASGPRACFTHLPHRSWFSLHWRGQILIHHDFYIMPYLLLH